MEAKLSLVAVDVLYIFLFLLGNKFQNILGVTKVSHY